MRVILSMGIAFGLVLALTSTSSAQFRRPGGNDPYSLLRNSKVKEELKLTDEQLKKLPAAALKALEGVLTKEQLARYKQIRYQQMGSRAFFNAEVQTALKFTDAQKSDLKDITTEAGTVMKKIYADMYSKDKEKRRDAYKKLGEFRKEMGQVISNVLTAEQKSRWEAMQGEKLELGGYKKGGKGGGFKKKPKN